VPTRSDRDSAPAVPARRADSQPWPLQGCGNRLIRAHARQLSQAVLRRDCHHLLMAGRPGTGESVAARVYAQLRIDILDRRLTPGERLKSAELAKRLGVGVNVIREALALLAAQNLVRVERNRGFYVTTLSPEARTDLTAARKINEGAALRLAVEQGEADWESEILAAHHRMASQPVHRPDDPATRLPAPATGPPRTAPSTTRLSKRPTTTSCSRSASACPMQHSCIARGPAATDPDATSPPSTRRC